jgi:translation elongation factor EF-Ts
VVVFFEINAEVDFVSNHGFQKIPHLYALVYKAHINKRGGRAVI